MDWLEYWRCKLCKCAFHIGSIIYDYWITNANNIQITKDLMDVKSTIIHIFDKSNNVLVKFSSRYKQSITIYTYNMLCMRVQFLFIEAKIWFSWKIICSGSSHVGVDTFPLCSLMKGTVNSFQYASKTRKMTSQLFRA